MTIEEARIAYRSANKAICDMQGINPKEYQKQRSLMETLDQQIKLRNEAAEILNGRRKVA